MTAPEDSLPQPLRATSLDGDATIRHGFFGRRGGVSAGLYASLNCGLGSGDDAGAVDENRARVAARLHIARDRLITAYQVHGRVAVRVEAPWSASARPRADCLVTNVPGIALGILTADCAPVLAADVEAGVIGAAHAGWRGALAGVTDALIAGMEALGARRSAIRAAIGPCISQPCYEVGPEMMAAFETTDPAGVAFFAPGARPDRRLFDLSGYVVDRLARGGVAAIEALGRCTYAEADLFFSFRRATHRGETDYGRALSAIALAPGPGLA